MGGSIPLHPTKGVNPRLSTCSKCGKDNGEILLIGTNEKIFECEGCDAQHLSDRTPKKCAKCGASNFRFVRKLEDNEKVAGGLCKECEGESNKFKAIVAAGGVYFRCVDCKAQGVVTAEALAAKHAREQLGIPAPKPCGIELNKDSCPRCLGGLAEETK